MVYSWVYNIGQEVFVNQRNKKWLCWKSSLRDIHRKIEQLKTWKLWDTRNIYPILETLVYPFWGPPICTNVPMSWQTTGTSAIIQSTDPSHIWSARSEQTGWETLQKRPVDVQDPNPYMIWEVRTGLLWKQFTSKGRGFSILFGPSWNWRANFEEIRQHRKSNVSHISIVDLEKKTLVSDRQPDWQDESDVLKMGL